MKTIKVKLNRRSYNIIVGSRIINLLGKYIKELNIGCDAYVITNARIKNKYGSVLSRALNAAGIKARFRLIPDTERSKSIKTASLIIKDIAAYDKKRRIFIIAFGGGVIGDLSGFIASIYKRGIPYIQVPTTLLAQVDSSIGGKTAVDLTEGKNLVGAFYQPRLVFSDVSFINTLDLKQMRCGLAEVIKYALIKDPQLFTYLEKNNADIFARRQGALEFIVSRCSRIKANIVRQDEREEKGLRTMLNFGHTIGHAIECAAGYRGYSHGEAVALGMLVACGISNELRICGDRLPQKAEALIKNTGLYTKIKRLSLADIIKAHYRDKKFIGPKNKFVLIKDVGKANVLENIPLSIIKSALKKRM